MSENVTTREAIASKKHAICFMKSMYKTLNVVKLLKCLHFIEYKAE